MEEFADGLDPFSPRADDEEAAIAECGALLGAVGDGVYRLDADGTFVAISDGLVELTGYEREALVGKDASVILGPEDRTAAEAAIRTMLDGDDETRSLDLSIRTAADEVVPCELQLSLLERDGTLEGTVGVLRKRADGTATTGSTPWNSESIVDDVLDVADVGVFVLNADCEVEWINETTERYFDLDRGEVLGRDKRDLVDESITDVVADPERFADAVLATYDDNTYVEEFDCEITQGEDREHRYLQHRSRPIESGPYAGGRVEVYYDVTDQHRITSELDETRRQLESLVEATEEYAIFMLDPDGRVETWNTGAEEILGYDRDAALDEHLSLFYTESDVAEGVPERNLEAASDGTVQDAGWRVTADGDRFWANVTVDPIHENGDLVGYGVVIRDMTEDRLYERRLEGQRESLREELDEVFERIDDAFYALDDEFRFTYVNERAEELLQQPADELLGESIWDAYPDATETDAWDAFHDALETQEATSYEVYFEPLNFWVEANVYPSESGLSVYFRDVTDRKQREKALEQSEQRYRTLAEQFPNGLVMLFDDDQRYTLAAGRAFEWLPLEPDDLEGRRPSDVFDSELGARIEAAFEAAFDGESLTTEINFDGQRWRIHTIPVRDDDGAIFAGMAMSQDVTEQTAIRNRLAAHNETLQELYEISADRERSFDAKVDDVLELGRQYLDLDAGLLSAIDPSSGRYEVTHARGDVEGFEPGAVSPLPNTYCRRAIVSDGLLGISDAGAEGWDDDPAFEASGLSCYLGGKVEVNGDLSGTLCFVATEPREEPFTDAEKTFAELASQWVSHELERERRERELVQYREYTDSVLDAVDDVFYTLDRDGTLQRWNESFRAVSGYDDELESMHVLAFFGEDDRHAVARAIEEAHETGSTRVEASFRTKDGEDIPYEFVASGLEDPDGDPVLVGIGRDISERLRREQELEQYRSLTEAAQDVIITIDSTSTIQSVNPAVEDLFGYDPGELVGEQLTTLMPEQLREQHLDGIRRYLESGERTLDWEYIEVPGRHADGHHLPLAVSFSGLEHGGEIYFTGIVRDITERREYEQKLERRQRQQAVIADLGQLALETDDIDDLIAEASRKIATTLETPYSKVLDLDEDAGEFRLRQGYGWPDELVGSATVTDDEDTQAGYTLRSEEPVVVDDLATETRFAGPDLLTDHDVTSGITTIIGSVDDSWGILGVDDTAARDFSSEDVNFVQSVANVLATAIEREQRQRQLEAQRERLSVLNSLHEVIGDITDAVIEQSTREEIEQIVCERLAGSDSYRFAWIGDVDTTSGLVTPRASAGTDRYLSELEISIDPDDERSQGPTGQAFIEGETRAVRDVQTDPAYDPWREAADDHGIRSTAAIPITYEDTIFGVLNVYADRHEAFDEEELDMMTHLGEIIGHAIAAVERKRALTSDEILEVELRIPDILEGVDAPPTDGQIAFDRVVPLDDDQYRVYGTADPEARDTLLALFEEFSTWGEGRIVNESETAIDFEVVTSELTLHGIVANHNGVVDSAAITGGVFDVSVHLPRGSDVRELIESVTAEYPNVDMLARRQITRSPDTVREVTRAFTEELTERQQIALETAFHGGYFEWPRGSSGEDIAEQLDIAAATFTQHLRAAERKLFETLFEELPTSA